MHYTHQQCSGRVTLIAFNSKASFWTPLLVSPVALIVEWKTTGLVAMPNDGGLENVSAGTIVFGMNGYSPRRVGCCREG